eukprot:Hpha_TRINITY_DN12914_c0_g2::TRINITY_DN12914_c0_g2_i1::g.164575::m.164575
MFRAAGRVAAAGLCQQSRRASAQAASDFVMHVTAPDRRGLLADVTGAVLKHGGDVHSSRATILGNMFSIMMVVQSSPSQMDGITNSLKNVKGNPEIWHRPSTSGAKFMRPGRKMRIFTITGLNTNGIVQGVCGLLAQRDISVMNLASEMTPAPFTDDPMFTLRAAVDMPADMEEHELEQGLEALSTVLGVDMWVKRWHPQPRD